VARGLGVAVAEGLGLGVITGGGRATTGGAAGVAGAAVGVAGGRRKLSALPGASWAPAGAAKASARAVPDRIAGRQFILTIAPNTTIALRIFRLPGAAE
jgi:hypothetical protein